MILMFFILASSEPTFAMTNSIGKFTIVSVSYYLTWRADTALVLVCVYVT